MGGGCSYLQILQESETPLPPHLAAILASAPRATDILTPPGQLAATKMRVQEIDGEAAALHQQINNSYLMILLPARNFTHGF